VTNRFNLCYNELCNSGWLPNDGQKFTWSTVPIKPWCITYKQVLWWAMTQANVKYN